MPPHRPAPVPPTIFPDDLRNEQGPGQGGTVSTGGSTAPPPTDPLGIVTPLEPAPEPEPEPEPEPDPAPDSTGSEEPHGADRYSVWEKRELQAEVDSRGLLVKGTGAKGNVLRGDLVSVLEENDES